jgi:O-antigen/teichoic acid export membrane protein
MGIVVRQSILTSIISYVGVIIGYINLLYLYPKFLLPGQIGLLRAIQDTAMLFTPFAMFGLGQSIIKFFPHFSGDEKRSGNFVTLILTMGLVTFGIFILVFLIFQDYFISFFDKNASNLIRYTPLILWLTFVLLFMTLLEQYSRSLLKIAFPAFLREIAIRLMQVLLVSLYFLEVLTFHQFLIWSVVIYVLVLVTLALSLVFQGNFRMRFSRSFVIGEKVKMKEIMVFSSLSFVGMSAMILVGKMDSVMVTSLKGFEWNAIYTTAFYMATVIEIPKRAITTSASTLIAQAFSKQNIAEVSSIYRKTSLNQFIIGALLLIGIWANLPGVFDIMPKGEIYRAGSVVVLIVGSGKLLDMLFGPSSEIIGLSAHYWFNLVVITVLAVIVIISNYLLIPRLGIEGAAYGTVLALFVYNATKFVFIYFKLGLQPFSWNTIKVIGIGGLVVGLNLVLPKADHVIVDMLYRSVVITIVFGGLILSTRASEEVNRLFFQVLRRLRGNV